MNDIDDDGKPYGICPAPGRRMPDEPSVYERLTDLQQQIDGLKKLIDELWDRHECLREAFMHHRDGDGDSGD